MNLFCDRHNDNHELTAAQVERVYYTLSAEYAAATVEHDGTPERHGAGQQFENHLPCPLTLLELSGSPEAWVEWVDGSVESRRARHREQRRVARGFARGDAAVIW